MRKWVTLSALGVVMAGIGAMVLGESPRTPAAKQALVRHERASEAARQEYLRKLIELDRTLIGELEAAKRGAMSASNLDEANRIEAAASAARQAMEEHTAALQGRSTFTIRADQDWQPTIEVSAGDKLSIRARGLWHHARSGGLYGPGGDPANRAGRDLGILQARIHEGDPVYIGEWRDLTAGESGSLQFRMRDSIHSDNRGEVEVVIIRR